MLKQLHLAENFAAGCPRNFLSLRTGQTTAGIARLLGTDDATGNTVEVIVDDSMKIVVDVADVVIVVNVVAVDVATESSVTVSDTTGVTVLRNDVTGSMER